MVGTLQRVGLRPPYSTCPLGVGENCAYMEDLNTACSMLDRQMALPLRHERLGLRMHSDEVADAAFVAGAGQAEHKLTGVHSRAAL